MRAGIFTLIGLSPGEIKILNLLKRYGVYTDTQVLKIYRSCRTLSHTTGLMLTVIVGEICNGISSGVCDRDVPVYEIEKVKIHIENLIRYNLI